MPLNLKETYLNLYKPIKVDKVGFLQPGSTSSAISNLRARNHPPIFGHIAYAMRDSA